MARPHGPVHDGIDRVALEPLIQRTLISQVQFGVRGRENLMTLREVIDEVPTNEAAAAGDEHPHSSLVPGIDPDVLLADASKP